MKVFYVILGLAILNVMPFACKADDAYSFFVSMPGGVTSYDEWLAYSKEATTACGESASTSIGTGRIVVKSAAGSLESRIFTRSISAGTALKSTDPGFMLIFR